MVYLKLELWESREPLPKRTDLVDPYVNPPANLIDLACSGELV